MRRASPPALAALLAAALLAAPARAAGPHPLRGDDRTDLAVTGAAAGVWLLGEVLKPELAPSVCRFCKANALDVWARDRLVLSDATLAARGSDVLAFALMPAAVTAHQLLAARAAGDGGEGWRDLLYVAEAASLSMAVNQVVKLAVGRQRPFVRYGNWAPGSREGDPDDNLSFYSGHSALAFSIASAAGTVSTLRGYGSAPWVWAVGMTLATGVGYLRMAGDKHWLTDVVVGAAVGGGVGAAVPLLLHGREDRPAPGGGASPAGARVVPLPMGVLVVW